MPKANTISYTCVRCGRSKRGHYLYYTVPYVCATCITEVELAAYVQATAERQQREDLQKDCKKTLGNCDAKGTKQNVRDVEIIGNGDMFQLLYKASSQSEGWMKSTKAMEIPGVGCVVQVTTQQGDNVAEALVLVPGVSVVDDPDHEGGRKLVSSLEAAFKVDPL